MTWIIIAILSGLIGSYRPKNDNYLKNFLKGIILGLMAFVIKFSEDYLKNDLMDFDRNILAFGVCLLIGVFGGLFFIITFHMRKIDD